MILVGAGFQLYGENYGQESIGDKIKSQEERIKQLENKYEALSTKSETNISTQNTNIQKEPQGAVAGASDLKDPSTSVGMTKPTTSITGKININTASASQLDALPGIGAVYSQRIIDYRNANGGFKSIDEIKNVKGIGDKTFEKFREQITI